MIGRSLVVGGPVAEMLKWWNATVINCHEHTKNLKHEVRKEPLRLGVKKKYFF